MKFEIKRDGYNIVVIASEFRGGKIFRLFWNKILGGSMLVLGLIFSPYLLIGAALGIFVELREGTK